MCKSGATAILSNLTWHLPVGLPFEEVTRVKIKVVLSVSFVFMLSQKPLLV